MPTIKVSEEKYYDFVVEIILEMTCPLIICFHHFSRLTAEGYFSPYIIMKFLSLGFAIGWRVSNSIQTNEKASAVLTDKSKSC